MVCIVVLVALRNENSPFSVLCVDVAHKVSDMYEAQLALEADSSEYSEDETGGMAVTLGDDLDTIYDEIMAELAMERS